MESARPIATTTDKQPRRGLQQKAQDTSSERLQYLHMDWEESITRGRCDMPVHF